MSGIRRIWADRGGSLTVEGVLVLPVIFLLMVVFLRLGFFLKESIQESADAAAPVRLVDTDGNRLTIIEDEGFGFLSGSLPGRRIRDTDLLIDAGYMIKDKIPKWFKND